MPMQNLAPGQVPNPNQMQGQTVNASAGGSGAGIGGMAGLPAQLQLQPEVLQKILNGIPGPQRQAFMEQFRNSGGIQGQQHITAMLQASQGLGQGIGQGPSDAQSQALMWTIAIASTEPGWGRGFASVEPSRVGQETNQA